MKILAPAKINLFFRVLGKRDDGYHEIASLYQAIDLFDRLFFSFSDQDKITCTNPEIPTDERNLVFKALLMFRKSYPVPPLHIHIEKTIPMQAGLGGGSSDAAATLKALNALMEKPASEKELIEMAKHLGSDVSFFFSNGTAFCTGRGETWSPFKLPAPISGWIAKPSFGLSTPEVYGDLRLEECSKIDPEKALQRFPLFFNDLEPAAFRLRPELKTIQAELKKHFQQVIMTGSGSAFFCLEGIPALLESIDYFPFCTMIPDQDTIPL